jgi:hypothetical protein
LHLSTLENHIITQSEKIADLEKSNRSLQNEKAVLAAAVEARESKLVKMVNTDKLPNSVGRVPVNEFPFKSNVVNRSLDSPASSTQTNCMGSSWTRLSDNHGEERVVLISNVFVSADVAVKSSQRSPYEYVQAVSCSQYPNLYPGIFWVHGLDTFVVASSRHR